MVLLPANYSFTLGSLLAVLVLVALLVLFISGQIALITALLIGALALARLT